ncbi:MAG: hypothetical protein LHV68_08415 [Elusimicrobia bacterium]|nr:hypothetical protein [Candidatus Liberimonas magnetica]
MDEKKTIGERVDKVVEAVKEKVEIVNDKIATTKENVVDIANDLSKSVKKAVNVSGAVVSELTRNK